jgi:type V secretory pathway adhesin AidA
MNKRTKRILLIAGSALLGLVVIGSILGSGKEQSTATPATANQSTAKSTSQSAPKPTPTTSVTPAPKPTPTTSVTPAPKPPTFTMPSEIGRVLQDAQDDLQRVSGNPVYYSASHDLLGSRLQILDRNWHVCTQSIAVGTTVSDNDTVDFGVVKLSESCP